MCIVVTVNEPPRVQAVGVSCLYLAGQAGRDLEEDHVLGESQVDLPKHKVHQVFVLLRQILIAGVGI